MKERWGVASAQRRGDEMQAWVMMIICSTEPRHNKLEVSFWGVNESSSDQIATRHLHGICATRVRRVKRTLCACLELKWTENLDGKRDPDREGTQRRKMAAGMTAKVDGTLDIAYLALGLGGRKTRWDWAVDEGGGV